MRSSTPQEVQQSSKKTRSILLAIRSPLLQNH